MFPEEELKLKNPVVEILKLVGDCRKVFSLDVYNGEEHEVAALGVKQIFVTH